MCEFILRQIDESNISDCYYLDSNDICHYWGTYTAGKGHSFSRTNQLISNIKKPMDRKSLPEWRYKVSDMKVCAELVRSSLDSIKEYEGMYILVVPIPPSKAKTDPMYDDRMSKIAHLATRTTITKNIYFDELVIQEESTESFHTQSRKRPTPEELRERYSFTKEIPNKVTHIILVDDVLTTGSHFKAIKLMIKAERPDIKVIGLFIAKTKHIEPEIPDLSITLDEL